MPDRPPPDQFFTADYYVNHNTGGHLDPKTTPIRQHSLMFRTFALGLNETPRAACDIGGGRGEMSRHLAAECGSKVYFVDYSFAACAIVASYTQDTGIEILNLSATEIGDYIPAGSLDLIFGNQFLQYLDEAELRVFFSAAAQLLAPGGHLVFSTPERKRGVEDTRQGYDGYAKKYWNADDLQPILAENFVHAEAFTWDGSERFDGNGKAIMLFGVASNRPYRDIGLDTAEAFLRLDPAGDWQSIRYLANETFTEQVRVEFTLQGPSAPIQGVQFQVLISRSGSASPKRYLQLPAEKLDGEKRRILLPGGLFATVDGSSGEFDTVEVRARVGSGADQTISVSNVRLARCGS